MRIYPKRERRSGYATQKVHGRVKEGMTSGYIKIWYNGRVVDRALTQKRALEMVRRFEQEGPLLAQLQYN